MVWKLRDLVNSCNSNQAEISGKWVPARPINYRYEGIVERIKASWVVLKGKAEAFTWPEGQ